MRPSKWLKHGFQDFRGVKFIHIEPKDLTCARLGELRVSVVLHKLSDWPLTAAELSAIEGELRAWGGRVLDRLESASLLCDRRRTCNLLQLFTRKHPVRLPLTGHCSTSTTLAFPVIRKPVAACRSKHTHIMCLFYSPEQLSCESFDCILQEFIPHGGVLYKIYVIGDQVSVKVRPSLLATEPGEPFVFDSQSIMQAGHLTPGPDFEETARDRLEKQMPAVHAFTKALQKELQLTVFGWDLILEEGTDTPHIIDVNYFPGYDKVDFLPLLVQTLLSLDKL